MAKVELKRITMDFGNVVALKDFSFETKDGEFLVILGPAGAGKTTTLKIIAGLYNPTRGRVIVDGKDITDVPANQRNMAMTFEDYALYPTFNVYQNLENPFGAMDPVPPREEVDKKIHEVAKMLQIDHLLDRKVDQLSGGQKQRVSLARCMVRSPQVFLFDEPLSHVDAKIRHSMRTELHRLSSVLATTTIYVTHDYVEALSLADRIVVIDKGVIQQIGTPHEIYDAPANEFVARVVGQPNINILNCQIVRKGEEICLQNPENPAMSFKPSKEDAAYINSRNLDSIHVGIRPQDIRHSLTPINHTAMQCKVELYELWGRRGMIMVNIGGEHLRILTNSDQAAHIGEPIWLDLNDTHLYLFDPSGMKLDRSEA